MTNSTLRLQHISELLRVIDFVVVVAVGYGIYLIYPGGSTRMDGEYALATLLGGAVCSWFRG